MITFVSGMPGDGKSYFIMTQIERELVETARVIVTNVELNLGNVAEYLHKKYGRTFDLHSRYFLLSHSQTKNFWLHRGTHDLALSPDGRCDFMTLDVSKPGVCYVIDELHEHFNARAWAKTGADALTYASQHRKLGDTVFFISQRAKQVDSQLRSLAGSYVYMRNLANRTLKLGPFVFRFGKTLIARAFPEELGKGNAEPPVMWTQSIKVEPDGHGSWYDTAAGVGVRGAVADKGAQSKRGIPAPLMALGVVVILAALWLVPKAIGSTFRTVLTAGDSAVSESTNVAPPAAVSPVVSAPVTASPLLTATNRLDLSRPRSIRVDKYGYVTVVLTNGLQVTTSDGIRVVGKEGFTYEGRVYPWP